MDNRQKVSELIKAAKGDWTWEQLAKWLGCSPVWLCSVFLGDSSLNNSSIWNKLMVSPNITSQVDLHQSGGRQSTDPEFQSVLERSASQPQAKAKENWAILSQDPLLYRLHEINLVYGRAIREVIHEKFGDGIMSAVDLKIDIDKVIDPNGDRVKITLDGKFLPYKCW